MPSYNLYNVLTLLQTIADRMDNMQANKYEADAYDTILELIQHIKYCEKTIKTLELR